MLDIYKSFINGENLKNKNQSQIHIARCCRYCSKSSNPYWNEVTH